MRSLFFISFLLIFTSLIAALSYWQWHEGSLNHFLGAPPIPIGENIYPNFPSEKVAKMILRSGDVEAIFEKTPKGWFATSPWKDRMDLRAGSAILSLAKTTRVVDFAERDQIDPALAGLGKGNTEIRYLDATGKSLAHFRLGRRTPWLELLEVENQKPLPTSYLLPLEKERKSHVYAAIGDLSPLFKNDFRYLRDHRPFFFDPHALGKIRIHTAEGELTLKRDQSSEAWRIVKPLNLAINPSALKKLLDSLSQLQATKVSNRSEVPLTKNFSNQDIQIALSPIGSNSETVLSILPPNTKDAADTLAMVSDRPDTIFTLPLKSELSLVSIADLPLTVNELRDRNLTSLSKDRIHSIIGIAIKTATTPTILISRQAPAPWMATIGDKEQLANEKRLFELLKALTETQVLSFETDAAPEDLSAWGLHRPILSLVLLEKDQPSKQLFFGLDPKGNLYAKRSDSASVMRIENRFLDGIAVNTHEWRHARLWSISKVDTTKLSRTHSGSVPIELTYQDLSETWNAQREGIDVSSAIDPLRAHFLLSSLESLEAETWLSPHDLNATNALKKPILTFQITQNTVDEHGDVNGSQEQILNIGTASGKFYGRLSSQDLPFTLDAESVLKLSVPILDTENSK